MSTITTAKSFTSSQTTITTSPHGPTVVSKLQRLLWLGNIVYYQLVAVLMFLMLWVFFGHEELSSQRLWHMVLCTKSYVPLMAVAIIAFSKDNLPTLYISRREIYAIHGALLAVSCASVTIGISLEINAKIKQGSLHFQSNHAILGLTSWILVLCSVCLGIVVSNTQSFAQYIKPVVAKLLHNFLGIGAFTLGVVTMMLMYQSHHYKTFLPSSAYYASYYVAAYIIVWSLLSAFKSLYFQVKNLVS